ncbi:MAG TPA: hypothetical protein DEA62_00690, partial [Coxiellaceae bacterium]|nr:hypothetical protein [Coxiellaceae bacterium]
PFLDRIDLWVLVSSLAKNALTLKPSGNITSAEIRARVVDARKYATGRAGKINAELTNKEIEKFCSLSSEDQLFLENVIE